MHMLQAARHDSLRSSSSAVKWVRPGAFNCALQIRRRGRLRGFSFTMASLLAQESVTATPAGDIVIHVFDDQRAIRQDFACDRSVLIESMGYFKVHSLIALVLGASCPVVGTET